MEDRNRREKGSQAVDEKKKRANGGVAGKRRGEPAGEKVREEGKGGEKGLRELEKRGWCLHCYLLKRSLPEEEGAQVWFLFSWTSLLSYHLLSFCG